MTINLEVSAENIHWAKMITGGTFPVSKRAQTVLFNHPRKVRYLKLTALEEANGHFYTSIAEIGVVFEHSLICKLSPLQQPPDLIILQEIRFLQDDFFY